MLGATFKPDSDDVRDSPALNVAGQIHLQGGQVTVFDPKGMDNARRLFPTLGYADTALDAVRGADVVLHLTEWREFRELDAAELGEVAGRRIILDGRNALDPTVWREADGPTGRWAARRPDARRRWPPGHRLLAEPCGNQPVGPSSSSIVAWEGPTRALRSRDTASASRRTRTAFCHVSLARSVSDQPRVSSSAIRCG